MKKYFKVFIFIISISLFTFTVQAQASDPAVTVVTFYNSTPNYSAIPGTYTWIVPDGVTSAVIKVWGAGGRGGKR